MKYENISMIGDDSLRYVLKKEGTNPLVVLGVNPSTANHLYPDPTIRKVMGFADRWGFDSFIMINLYPQRATNPKQLDTELNNVYHKDNITNIIREVGRLVNPTILMAYGNLIEVRPYLKKCLNEIVLAFPKFQNIKFIQLGDLTKLKHPRHPLMVSYTTEIRPYSIEVHTHN